MTHLNNGQIVLTDLSDTTTNNHLTGLGYTIRHVETWAGHDDSIIAWDRPKISEADLPY